jgi:hypothetical protein
LEEQLQQPTLEQLIGASATQTRKHPPGILCKAWPDVYPRYRGIPLQSPVYVPNKDWQLGCQHANSHQAGTVESRVDHNEKGIEPETYQGYREKMVRKTTEDLKQIRDPQIPVANANDGIPKQSLYMCSPLRLVRLWRGYLYYLSARDLVFIPCVRGGSWITFMKLDLDTPYLRLQYLSLNGLEEFPLQPNPRP